MGEKELVQGAVGPVQYNFELKDGKVVLSLSYAGPDGIGLALSVSDDPVPLLEKLKAALPKNVLIDEIIDGAELALKV